MDVAARLGEIATGDDTVTAGGAPRAAGGPFRLRVDQGPTDTGRSFPFRARRVSVGRLPENDLPLPCERVSKCHFFIRWDDEQRAFLLIDNDSRNGVHVNGKTVNVSRQLAHGDLIRVADYLLQFTAE